MDSLAVAHREILRPHDTPSFVRFHYLAAVASELGVFLPIYDPLFMNSLTKFYDGEHYEERRRTGNKQHTKLEHPHLSIIGGTTPSYLNSFLPEGAWDQGFTSRTIFIYSGEAVHTPLFGARNDFSRLESVYNQLLLDLKSIAHLYGEFAWAPDAASAISAWYEAGLPPVPEHNKLVHYNIRRLAHALKLCMVASVSRSNDLTITLEDFQNAQNWLVEAEARMLDIFTNMGIGGDSRAMDDAFDFVFRLSKKENQPIVEHRLVNHLRQRVASHNVMRVIEIMWGSGLLKKTVHNGVNAYLPGSKGDDN